MENKEFLKAMGKRIRVIRLSKGLILRDISKLTGYDKDALGDIELGRCSSRILTLKAIADVLNVDVKDFL